MQGQLVALSLCLALSCSLSSSHSSLSLSSFSSPGAVCRSPKMLLAKRRLTFKHLNTWSYIVFYQMSGHLASECCSSCIESCCWMLLLAWWDAQRRREHSYWICFHSRSTYTLGWRARLECAWLRSLIILASIKFLLKKQEVFSPSPSLALKNEVWNLQGVTWLPPGGHI